MADIRKATLETSGTTILQPLYGNWFVQRDETSRLYIVQEKRANLNEYNVALGLDTVKLDYIFQLSIAGGRMIAFGIVLDFLVLTVPLPTALWVHGEYWHMGAQREVDRRQQSLVDLYMGGEIAWPPVEIWGDQSDTYERALAAVRRNFL